MKRERVRAPPNWRERCEGGGLFLSLDGRHLLGRVRLLCLYRWRRSTSSRRRPRSSIGCCLEACDHIVRERKFEAFAIPEPFVDFVADSWRDREPTLYGRFDLAWDGTRPAEAARVQRRYADRALRGERRAVVLAAATSQAGRRPVQLDPREADRALRGDARPNLPVAPIHFAVREGSATRTSATSNTCATARSRPASTTARVCRSRTSAGMREREAVRRPRGRSRSRPCSSSIRGSG